MSREERHKKEKREKRRKKFSNRAKTKKEDNVLLEDKNSFIKSKKILSTEKQGKSTKRKKIIYFFIIILLLLFNLLTVSYLVYKNFIKSEDPIKQEVIVDASKLRLNVVDLKSNTRPFAVMIDNNEDAWPQFNINEAVVVYEMLVEGGLSRLMAIFKDKPELEKIGPLRSARHYFIDYLKEYDAIYVHEGYSPRAIREIYSRKVDTIVYTSGLFYRDKTRWAPHNAITSGERMLNAAKKRGHSLTTDKKMPLKYSRLPVKLENPISATTINTGFSSYAKLKLVYNEETKKYEKHEIGEALKDAVSKQPMAATNIIILQASSSRLTGYGAGKGRIHIDTTQDMSGYFFTCGEGVKINAKKQTRNSDTIYTLENGKELRINDGNTFIFLVPKSQKINITGKEKVEGEENLEEQVSEPNYITLEELQKDERVKITKIEHKPDEFNIFDFIKMIFTFNKKEKINEDINEENVDNEEVENIETNEEVTETEEDKKAQ